jgi:hypothetical protein
MNPIKIVVLLRKAEKITEESFRRYFRSEYLDGLLATKEGKAGIDRIVLNNVLENNFRPTTNPAGHSWSAVGEFYCADAKIAGRLLTDPEFSAAARGRADTVAVSSQLIIDEKLEYDFLDRRNAFKVFGFFRITLPRERPLTREECFVSWGSHADHCVDEGFNQFILKYTQNRAVLGTHNSDPTFDYDGASIVWFPTMEAAKHIYQNDAVEDETNKSGFEMGTEPAGCMYLRTDEQEVYWRQALVA